MPFDFKFENYPIPTPAKANRRVNGKATITPIGGSEASPMYQISELYLDGVLVRLGTPLFALANVWIRGNFEPEIIAAISKHRDAVS